MYKVLVAIKLLLGCAILAHVCLIPTLVDIWRPGRQVVIVTGNTCEHIVGACTQDLKSLQSHPPIAF